MKGRESENLGDVIVRFKLNVNALSFNYFCSLDMIIVWIYLFYMLIYIYVMFKIFRGDWFI